MLHANSRRGQTGVTLLELAIVVAILGLLLGAVFIGLEVLAEAEFVEGLDRLDSAINGARLYRMASDRNKRFPGDDDDATKPWVTILGGPPAAGDADKLIELGAGEDALIDLIGRGYLGDQDVRFDTTAGVWHIAIPWAAGARFDSGISPGAAGGPGGWEWTLKGVANGERPRNFVRATTVDPLIARRIIDLRNGGSFANGPIQVVDPATGLPIDPDTTALPVDIIFSWK